MSDLMAMPEDEVAEIQIEQKLKAIAEYCGWEEMGFATWTEYWIDAEGGPPAIIGDILQPHGLKSLLDTLHADERFWMKVDDYIGPDGGQYEIQICGYAATPRVGLTQIRRPDFETALIDAAFKMLRSL